MGHALGLYHPDQAAKDGLNLKLSLDRSRAYNRTDPLTGQPATSVTAGVPGSSWTCMDPWANVVVNNASAADDSLMTAFTQTPKGVCVRQDDLDGINSLYPPCANQVSEPQCWKSEQYLGLVRLTMYVALPAVAILLVTLATHAGLTFVLKSKRDSLVKKNPDSVSEADRLRMQMQDKKGRKGKPSGVKAALAERKKHNEAVPKGECNSSSYEAVWPADQPHSHEPVPHEPAPQPPPSLVGPPDDAALKQEPAPHDAAPFKPAPPPQRPAVMRPAPKLAALPQKEVPPEFQPARPAPLPPIPAAAPAAASRTATLASTSGAQLVMVGGRVRVEP